MAHVAALWNIIDNHDVLSVVENVLLVANLLGCHAWFWSVPIATVVLWEGAFAIFKSQVDHITSGGLLEDVVLVMFRKLLATTPTTLMTVLLQLATFLVLGFSAVSCVMQ